MPIRLEDLLASFRRHLRAASKAPRTIELYSQSVRYFSHWLAEHDRSETLDELTRHAISAWLAEIAENCEPSTVATRLRGMRRFCRWLVVEGEVDTAPTEGIEIAVAPDKPVPILTDAEITALLRTCAVGRGRPGVFARPIFFARRDEVVLRLLLDTGIRVSELCGLNLADVDLERGLAYVTGKRLTPPGGALRREDRPGHRPLPPHPCPARPCQLTPAAARPARSDDPLVLWHIRAAVD